MAKAIVGSFADPRTFALLEEVRALRARVAELESALAEAESQSSEHILELDREGDAHVGVG